MNVFKQICSHCRRNFWQCRCDTFHPPVEIKDEMFELSLEEVASLRKYFHECGYISHEFHQSIHDLISKMDLFLGNVKG
jgi:hypothetical protein